MEQKAGAQRITVEAAHAAHNHSASTTVFRYALLMHGKRPTLPDLLGVIRAS
ncbi:MAG: hypothetical protein OSB03_10385 [Vicinamibacterales bacterium]|nr:hypothetical protein [Vicinamibacterales bacterium]